MGYESKLYIGIVTTIKYYDDKSKNLDDKIVWFQDYAQIDMCKIGGLDYYHADHQKVFIYGSDGNTQIIKDRYGDPLVAIPIEEVYDTLDERAKADDYRRYIWALALMKSMMETQKGLHVVHFGH